MVPVITTKGQANMIRFIPITDEEEAKKEATGACMLAEVEGGFMAFETYEDYKNWKNDGEKIIEKS